MPKLLNLFKIFLLLSATNTIADVYIDVENTFNTTYNYSPYQFFQMQQNILMTLNYTLDTSAGSIATSTIDFSATQQGKFSIGFGLGTGISDFDNYSTAGAFGLKYGITDDSAIISKGWVGSNGGSAFGIGWNFDF